jgi:glycerate kinase
MNFVIANDSFKGTLDQLEAADIIASVIKKTGSETVKKPMSDGGDGLLKCLDEKYRTVTARVVGPEGQSVKGKYRIYEDTAVIETAEACGIHLLSESLPGERTTYGVGELIMHAINNGAKTIIIGLGGSATNDGGYGMFKALGGCAVDSESKPVLSLNKHIDLIDKIDKRSLTDLSSIDLIIASDVNNPLLGERGAVQVFGPQKGITADKLSIFEERLFHLYSKMMDAGFKDFKDDPGAGAAGGLGWMLLTLGARIQPGGPLVSELLHLEEAVANADYVITGEGKSDTQTMDGKVPSVVLEICKKHHVPCILLSGQVEQGFTTDFHRTYSLVDNNHDVKTVLKNPAYHLHKKTEELVKDIIG